MSGAPEDLSPARVAELMRNGAQVIDVREQYERDAGRIPDASAHLARDRLASRPAPAAAGALWCSPAAPARGRGLRRRPLRRPATTPTISTAGSRRGWRTA